MSEYHYVYNLHGTWRWKIVRIDMFSGKVQGSMDEENWTTLSNLNYASNKPELDHEFWEHQEKLKVEHSIERVITGG